MADTEPAKVIWFWPVNDRASMHARLAQGPWKSLCERWTQGLGEDVEPPGEDDSRPICKRCTTLVARL